MFAGGVFYWWRASVPLLTYFSDERMDLTLQVWLPNWARLNKGCPTFGRLSVCGVKQEGRRSLRCHCLNQLPFLGFSGTFEWFKQAELTDEYMGERFLYILSKNRSASL